MSTPEPPSTGSDDKTVFREDATIIRTDSYTQTTTSGDASTSGEASGHGQADAPKILKQRFVLEDKLGSGGMGTVFKAKDLRKVEARDAQPYVAIKVLNNDFRQHPEAFVALEREASKSQTLRHTNVVSIFDFDKDGDLPFITMQLLEGKELSEWLRAYPSGLPEDLAWRVIEDLIGGLNHAHSEGVVHADFKPGNVFVCKDQSSKILDFGIARAVRSNQVGDDTDFDPARLAALTPAYASREMLNGDNPEPRDDIFSLGVVIYMVLTGRHPYGRVPATDACQEGMRPERIKSLSRRRWKALSKCLAFNRSDRPDSVQEVREAFFGDSRWLRTGIAASVLLLTGSILTAYLHEPADIREVRNEVRQATLVDAQVRRLDTLLTAPEFSLSWLDQVLLQIEELNALDGTHEETLRVVAVAREQIQNYVLEHLGLAEVGKVLERVETSASAEQLEEGVNTALEKRLLAELDSLSQAEDSPGWRRQVLLVQALHGRFLAESQALIERRSEFADAVLPTVLANIAHDPELGEWAWATFGTEVQDAQTRADIADAVQVARQASAAEVERQSMEAERTRLFAALDNTLNVSCLRLDVAAIDQVVSDAGQAHQSALRHRAAERIEACATRLAKIDVQQAEELLLAGRGYLSKQARRLHADPCAETSSPSAREAACADQIVLPGGRKVSGPRLVVVPGNDGEKLAVAKYELSWGELKPFCEQTDQCEIAQQEENLPVTGIGVSLIEKYAHWLSKLTGYRYRLPTLDEWQAAAVGEPDPNRNCFVDVGGVRRGRVAMQVDNGKGNVFGLVHLFGNAQEVVTAEDGYKAVGGGYNDPIEQCLADNRRHLDITDDPQVGYRLVRELS